MPDHMTPTQRSRAMKRVKLKGGPLELLVQRELRRLGLRFQKNYRRVDGTPDIAFPEKKVAIFIDGDFWHGWRLPAWEDKLSDFWKSKLHANRRCFRHQLLLPRPYLVLTKPLRLDIQCQRGASVKIGWKYLDD